MPLPKIRDTNPKYDLILPSNGKKVVFTPFTVKEEKLLYNAMDTEDENVLTRALKQVINNCLETPLDVENLPMFDVDYLWLKMRSKSVDEQVVIPFECTQPLPSGTPERFNQKTGEMENTCGYIVNVPVNFDKIEIKKNPENDRKIMLTDKIGLMMRYPTIEIAQRLAKVEEDPNKVDTIFDVIVDCIDMIFEGELTYEREHTPKPELMDFLESLTQPQFSKILKFFETLPVLKQELHFRCPKCKHEVDMVIEGNKTFLASASLMTVQQT